MSPLLPVTKRARQVSPLHPRRFITIRVRFVEHFKEMWALVEEGDRWQQALLYAKIARKCFDEALKRTGHAE